MLPKWITWQQVASLIQADDGIRLLLSVEQMVDVAVSAPTIVDFLRLQMPELAGEIAASSAGSCISTPDWVVHAHHGRIGLNEMPKSLLMDVLDRDAVSSVPDSVPGTFLIAARFAASAIPNRFLSLLDEAFPTTLCRCHAAVEGGWRLWIFSGDSIIRRRIEQLQSILKISLKPVRRS